MEYKLIGLRRNHYYEAYSGEIKNRDTLVIEGQVGFYHINFDVMEAFYNGEDKALSYLTISERYDKGLITHIPKQETYIELANNWEQEFEFKVEGLVFSINDYIDEPYWINLEVFTETKDYKEYPHVYVFTEESDLVHIDSTEVYRTGSYTHLQEDLTKYSYTHLQEDLTKYSYILLEGDYTVIDILCFYRERGLKLYLTEVSFKPFEGLPDKFILGVGW